jgi:hypothetical protein
LIVRALAKEARGYGITNILGGLITSTIMLTFDDMASRSLPAAPPSSLYVDEF